MTKYQLPVTRSETPDRDLGHERQLGALARVVRGDLLEDAGEDGTMNATTTISTHDREPKTTIGYIIAERIWRRRASSFSSW